MHFLKSWVLNISTKNPRVTIHGNGGSLAAVEGVSIFRAKCGNVVRKGANSGGIVIGIQLICSYNHIVQLIHLAGKQGQAVIEAQFVGHGDSPPWVYLESLISLRISSTSELRLGEAAMASWIFWQAYMTVV